MVDRMKPYKPIFICFIDLIFAITFIISSMLYFWCKLDLNMKTVDSYKDFMPRRVFYYDLIFLFKFFLDIFYLRMVFPKKKLNSSTSTSSLFWFRIAYDLIMFAVVMLVFRY